MPQTDKWSVRCTTEDATFHWYLPPGSSAPTTCPNDTGHTIDGGLTALEKPAGTSETDDGALRVKQDPGNSETDPKFYPNTFTVPTTAGDHWFDLDCPAGSLLQYLSVQVKDPAVGDVIGVRFRLISDDTEVGSFGGINPSYHVDASGWSLPRRAPKDQGSAKEVPAGVKVSIKFTSADAAGRTLAVDACCHE